MAQQAPISIPFYKIWLRKIFRVLLYVIKYPFLIKNIYGYHNAMLFAMESRIGNKPKDLINMRKKNVQNVNIAIFLPICLGILANVMLIMNDQSIQERYHRYATIMTNPVKGSNAIVKGFRVVKRVFLGVTKYNPVKFSDISLFFIGYGISIGGAIFLSMNPVFKMEQKIQDVLAQMKKTFPDTNKPWIVVWSENYLYFETYGCNPSDFKNDEKFWHTISFYPDDPIVFEKERNKFIIPMKYQLPEKIEFKVKNKNIIQEPTPLN